MKLYRAGLSRSMENGEPVPVMVEVNPENRGLWAEEALFVSLVEAERLSQVEVKLSVALGECARLRTELNRAVEKFHEARVRCERLATENARLDALGGSGLLPGQVTVTKRTADKQHVFRAIKLLRKLVNDL